MPFINTLGVSSMKLILKIGVLGEIRLQQKCCKL